MSSNGVAGTATLAVGLMSAALAFGAPATADATVYNINTVIPDSTVTYEYDPTDQFVEISGVADFGETIIMKPGDTVNSVDTFSSPYFLTRCCQSEYTETKYGYNGFGTIITLVRISETEILTSTSYYLTPGLPQIPYNLSAVSFAFGSVPEPATWSILLAGFGAMGGAIRWRRRWPDLPGTRCERR